MKKSIYLTLLMGTILLSMMGCSSKRLGPPKQDQEILNQLLKTMQDHDKGAGEGTLYSLTKDNDLGTCKNARDCYWILQTPNVWGMPASEVKKNAGIHVLDEMVEAIENAEKFVDITTLSDGPPIAGSNIMTGEFTTRIIAAIKGLAIKNKSVTIRILGGTPPYVIYGSAKVLMEKIVAEIGNIKTGNLRIYVAAQKLNDASWNHAKIIAVDGKRTITGGQNLWGDAYLGETPVHDLNIQLEGSAAASVHYFADRLWERVCNSVNPVYVGRPYFWETGAQKITRSCLPRAYFPAQPGTGDTWVLTAGRIQKINEKDPGDVAMLKALDMAKSSIFLSQQTLNPPPIGYWKNAVNALGDALARGVKIYYVQSNHLTTNYAGVSLETIGRRLKLATKQSKYNTRKKNKELNELLCKNLNLAELRFNNTDDVWPNAKRKSRFFGNHAKFFMIDNGLFYIGSRNLYAGSLQELGVFLSDETSAKEIQSHYWSPLWNYSKRTAVSGESVANCMFK